MNNFERILEEVLESNILTEDKDTMKKFSELIEEAYNEEIPSCNVGDIYYNSWGYEQTNVDFFKVVKTTAKSATFQELEKKEKSDGAQSMTGSVTPTDKLKGSTFNRRISNYIKGPSDSSGYLHKWDGKPKRVSHYA